MTEGDNLWHVSQQGKVFGPYTSEMLQRYVDAGRFASHALVWRSELTVWQPIALHFTVPTEIQGNVEKRSDVSEVPNVHSVSLRPDAVWVWGGLSVLGLVLIHLLESLSTEWSPNATVAVRVILLIVILVSAGRALWLGWRKLQTASPNSAWVGFSRVGIIGVASALGVYLFVVAVQMPSMYRLLLARESFRHYTVEVDGGRGALSISGTIGPGLAARVVQHIKANAAIQTIEIDSLGGLVAEAKKIAEAIEQRGNLSTANTGTCNSACIVVFMAGTRRIAPVEASFGFHATSSVVVTNGVYDQETIAAEGVEAERYLIRRGVPEEFVSKARAIGADSVYTVSTTKMASVGAVTAVTHDGEEIDLDQAKWLDLIQRLQRSKINPALVALLNTAADLDPDVPAKSGPQLWEALQGVDVTKVGAALQAAIRPIVAKGIAASEDGPLAQMLVVTKNELAHLRNTRNWAICAGFMNGKGFGGLKPPEDLLTADLEAQEKLLRSAAARNWQPIAAPAWADEYGTRMAAQLVQRLGRQGINVARIDEDERTSCEWSTSLISEIADKSPEVSAGLYRWLIEQGK